MKNWIINKKIAIIITFIGAVAGYSYWYFVGCESGTCAITSVWYRTTIYGAIMGWLLGSLISENIKKKTNEN
jgi:membrane associated rhomboid family serine protease